MPGVDCYRGKSRDFSCKSAKHVSFFCYKADAFLTVVIQVLCAGVCVELLSPRGHNGRHDKCTHINKIFSPLEIVLLLQNSELFKDSRD